MGTHATHGSKSLEGNGGGELWLMARKARKGLGWKGLGINRLCSRLYAASKAAFRIYASGPSAPAAIAKPQHKQKENI